MNLAIRMLSSSSTLNSLQYVNQVIVNPGSTATVYFQLVDLDQQDPASKIPGERYMPILSSTMQLGIFSINYANNLTKIPINPFSQDNSIWSFNLSAADTAIAAGVNMKITLTQGSQINIINASGVLIIGAQSCYQC